MPVPESPLLSIITVCYNAEKSIAATMETVLNQSYRNFEYLIIDGASTDNTLSIARQYPDERIRLLSEPDKGIYDAMNKAIAMAKGDWLYFMNAGDTFHDAQVLEDFFSKALPAETDLLYGQVLLKNHPSGVETVVQEPVQFSSFFFKVGLCHQAVFTHASLFKKLGPYQTEYSSAADQEWFIRYFKGGDHSLFIPRIVADYDSIGASYKKRISGIREYNHFAAIHFPWHIVWLRRLRHPFLILKVKLLRLLEHSALYKAYRQWRFGNK